MNSFLSYLMNLQADKPTHCVTNSLVSFVCIGHAKQMLLWKNDCQVFWTTVMKDNQSCTSNQKMNNWIKMFWIKMHPNTKKDQHKRMIAGIISCCKWHHNDKKKVVSMSGPVSKYLIQVPEVLFSFSSQSHQMILGQYSPRAVEFLSYFMTWKNCFNQKGAYSSTNAHSFTLICPHAVGSS